MSVVRAILTNTDVTSAVRKVVLSIGSIGIAKYVTNPEIAGGLILLLGSLLQAWSKYDDARIKRAEHGPERHPDEKRKPDGIDERRKVEGPDHDGWDGDADGVRPHDPPGA